MVFYCRNDHLYVIFNDDNHVYNNEYISNDNFNHDYHDQYNDHNNLNHDYHNQYDNDNNIDKYQYEYYNITMPDNLVDNDTHVTDFRGTLKTGTKLPVDGDEIQNVEAGDMFFDTEKEVLYGYSGTAWYGVKGFTTSTSSSTSTSTTTTA